MKDKKRSRSPGTTTPVPVVGIGASAGGLEAFTRLLKQVSPDPASAGARSHADLQSHTEELARFNHVAVGRELRMIELKKEVNDLCRRQGEAARYPLEFEQDGKDADG